MEPEYTIFMGKNASETKAAQEIEKAMTGALGNFHQQHSSLSPLERAHAVQKYNYPISPFNAVGRKRAGSGVSDTLLEKIARSSNDFSIEPAIGAAAALDADVPGTSSVNMSTAGNSYEAMAREREERFGRLVGNWGTERENDININSVIRGAYLSAKNSILNNVNSQGMKHNFSTIMYSNKWYTEVGTAFQRYRKVKLFESIRKETGLEQIEAKALNQVFGYFESNKEEYIKFLVFKWEKGL